MSDQEDYDEEVSTLYRESAGRVLGFLIGMGCEPWLAEEITDDAFMGARRYWDHVRHLDEPLGYVFKIARRERNRRQPEHERRARDLHQDPAKTASTASDDFASGIADRAALLHALERLPARMREAVVLRLVGGLSEAEAAAVMGVSVGSVKSFTSHGRARLRAHLEEFGTGREEKSW
jgi:RNA polymerase sigma factor (sigma-70 family)